MHDTYQSPLVARNASKEMCQLFSMREKIRLWRMLWVSLAKNEKALGLSRITDEAITQMEANVNNIDFDVAAAWEKRTRHDVMAHIHAFEEVAPAAKGIIHLGATSQFVVDNADLYLMRKGLWILRLKLVGIVKALAKFAAEYRSMPTLGYTHYQPAQLTTVGKRACLWAQDFLIDLGELEYRSNSIMARGVKGTTGTQASFLSLFDGDHAKCDELDQLVSTDFCFPGSYEVTGQTYPRKIDAAIINSLAQTAASVHKFCNDIRLLAGMKQMEEPFESEQVGSSAMAYKRNPMRCERATGLARFIISIANSPMQTAAEQWFERTLDDSSNKRLSIPEAFLALDGALQIVLNVVRGLVVYPGVIKSYVDAELPFMATEEILMAAVKAGGDRQVLHEAIRHHSQAAAHTVKDLGDKNDLMDRLCADPLFDKVKDTMRDVLDPAKFIGRAPEQLDHFITTINAATMRYPMAESNSDLKV